MSTIKIYFAPTDWASSKQVYDDYKYQTPDNDGVWENIQAVFNPDEADFLIIQDSISDSNLLNKFKPSNRLYFNREALSIGIIDRYPASQYTRFSFWDGSGYLPIRWWYGSNVQMSPQGYSGIPLTYDELKKLQPPIKTEKICSILTDKEVNDGHRVRKRFAKQYLSKYSIDLYGSIQFKNSEIPSNDKSKVLEKYEYCLGFDNQDFIKGFFGTQCTDSLLMWTVPIFWCGTDLRDYLPEGSFIQFNARDLNEIDRIHHIIENDDYDSRLRALAEARKLILDTYNFWPTIQTLISKIK